MTDLRKQATRVLNMLADAGPMGAKIEVIESALQAERERCAKAAEQRGKELGEPAIGSDIANTIRDPA
jgi:hypothetical protein